MSLSSSTPSITEFDPTQVPYQYRVISDVRSNFDYSEGAHEFLLSGSVGSAKSILLAHLIITHCLMNEKARACIGRKTMPDLKDTILAKILEHMEGDLIEGRDYEVNHTRGMIQFYNGSEIISRSWADKKYKKFRSLELSAAAIEELTENNEEDKSAYEELRMRIGRLPHVKENWLGAATNPDAPSHWAYKYFITSKHPNRHVYYSVTTDNPFLPKWYIDQLLTTLDPKMARRMIFGEWLEIATEVVYYGYNSSVNYRDETYTVDTRYPVHLCFDFNIGVGKPMSACAFQFVDGAFHFFQDFIVEGARTEDMLEEIAGRGLFEYRAKLYIHGDATGRSRDTRSKRSDYDIIDKFLANFERASGGKLDYEIQVPLANPPVRARHNTVNAYMRNAKGEVSLYVYKGAPTLDEGFRLTKLKSGGQYIEDDSPAYQHVTTAAGYGIMEVLKRATRKPQSTVEL